jgi:other hect domain ubiquitin protein ligase E3
MEGVGTMGRDKWIPNPGAKSPFCLKMFEFFGKLLGVAIRSKNPLPIDLPTLFWKSLVRPFFR